MIPKFRAWDKLNESMCDVANIDFMTKVVELRHAVPFYFLPFSEVALMQSTGLKDVNGVEIYEGDIVEVRYLFDTDSLDSWSVVGAVKNYASEGYPAFDLDFKTNILENRLSVITQSGLYVYKVIGNIYENPELLEVEE